MSDQKKPESDAAFVERVVEFVPFLQREAIKLSIGMVQRYLCKPTKSGAVCTDAQALRFIMLCKARGLNPFEGDAFVIGYDAKDGPEFSLITAHQAFMKRAADSPKFSGMDSGVIVKTAAGEIVDREGDFFLAGDVLLGGWATVFRRDWDRPMKARVRLESFNQGRSRWNVDAGGMIVKCAEADALRRSFPNQLGGMYSESESLSLVESPAAATDDGPPVGKIELRTQPPVPSFLNGQEVRAYEKIHEPAPAPQPAPAAAAREF